MKQLGVIAPIVTPCTSGGHVDVEGLQIVCRDMIQAGCHGIFVLGSTGRGPWFTREDRAKICKAAAHAIGSRLPLMAGCMAAGVHDMIENAKAMADSGATIAVATALMYFKYASRELENIFLTFADASPIPVIIYDIPCFAGADLGPNLLAKLSAHENILGFKDSSSNYENFEQLLGVLSTESPQSYVLQGKEHLLKDSLAAGASGFIVSLLHVDPRPFISLYDAIQKGDRDEANRLQEVITGVMNLADQCFAKRPQTSTLFHFLNTSLHERGIDVNIRLPHEGACPDWITRRAKEAVVRMSSCLGKRV